MITNLSQFSSVDRLRPLIVS